MPAAPIAAEPVAVVWTTADKETLSLFVPVKVSLSEKTSVVLFVPVFVYIFASCIFN